MKKLFIVGAGGFGREVAWLVERINENHSTWDLVGFIDDNENVIGSFENQYKVLGNCQYLSNLKEDVYVVCAIGDANIRKKVVEKLKQYDNVKFATIIDPSVIMSNLVKVGEGTIICAGTIITVNVEIGNHVIINLDTTIGHDDIIKDYVTIYPSVNVSGNVVVEECVELGTGTQIIQGKSICNNVIIGASATVIKDVTESGTYVGSPARRIK